MTMILMKNDVTDVNINLRFVTSNKFNEFHKNVIAKTQWRNNMNVLLNGLILGNLFGCRYKMTYLSESNKLVLIWIR